MHTPFSGLNVAEVDKVMYFTERMLETISQAEDVPEWLIR